MPDLTPADYEKARHALSAYEASASMIRTVATAIADEREQDAQQSRDIAEALDSLDTVLATNVRDWGANKADSWLWAIICGWDSPDEPTEDAMGEQAAKWGWTPDTVARLRRYHSAIATAIRRGKERCETCGGSGRKPDNPCCPCPDCLGDADA